MHHYNNNHAESHSAQSQSRRRRIKALNAKFPGRATRYNAATISAPYSVTPGGDNLDLNAAETTDVTANSISINSTTNRLDDTVGSTTVAAASYDSDDSKFEQTNGTEYIDSTSTTTITAGPQNTSTTTTNTQNSTSTISSGTTTTSAITATTPTVTSKITKSDLSADGAADGDKYSESNQTHGDDLQYSGPETDGKYSKPANIVISRIDKKSDDIYITSPIQIHFHKKSQVHRSKSNVKGGASARKILGVIPDESEFAQSTQREVDIITAIERDLKEQPQLKRMSGPARLKYQNDPEYEYQLHAQQAMEDTQMGVINRTRPRFQAKVLSKRPIRIRTSAAPASAAIPHEPEAKQKDEEAPPVTHKWIICDSIQASQVGVFNANSLSDTIYSPDSFSIFTNPRQYANKNSSYSNSSKRLNIKNDNDGIYYKGTLQQLKKLHKLSTPSDSSSLEPSPTLPLTTISPSIPPFGSQHSSEISSDSHNSSSLLSFNVVNNSINTINQKLNQSQSSTTSIDQSQYSLNASTTLTNVTNTKTHHSSSLLSSNTVNNSLNVNNGKFNQHRSSIISMRESQHSSITSDMLINATNNISQCSGSSLARVASPMTININNNVLNIANNELNQQLSSNAKSNKLASSIKKRSRTRKRGRKKRPKLTDYVIGEHASYKGRSCCIINKEVEYEQPTVYTVRFLDDNSQTKTIGKHLLYDPKPIISPSSTNSPHSTKSNAILTSPTSTNSLYSSSNAIINITNNNQKESVQQPQSTSTDTDLINVQCTQCSQSKQSSPSITVFNAHSALHITKPTSNNNINEEESKVNQSSILYISANTESQIEPSELINDLSTTPGDYNLRELSPSDPLLNEAQKGLASYYWSYYDNHWRQYESNSTNIYAIKWMIAVIIRAIHAKDASFNQSGLNFESEISANITNKHVNMVNLNVSVIINEANEQSKYEEWVKHGIIKPPAKFNPNFKSRDYMKQKYFNEVISHSPGLTDAAFGVAANIIPNNHNNKDYSNSTHDNDKETAQDILMNMERPVDDIVLGSRKCALAGGGKTPKTSKSKRKKSSKTERDSDDESDDEEPPEHDDNLMPNIDIDDDQNMDVDDQDDDGPDDDISDTDNRRNTNDPSIITDQQSREDDDEDSEDSPEPEQKKPQKSTRSKSSRGIYMIYYEYLMLNDTIYMIKHVLLSKCLQYLHF